MTVYIIVILTALILATFFLMGAAIGSFLSVVIDRLPRKESIVFSPSHCTNCKTRIKWFQNIPVFSYVFLKGKCSNCQAKIPIKYFLIELFFGSVGLAVGTMILSTVISFV